jgi:hypothetical protein
LPRARHLQLEHKLGVSGMLVDVLARHVELSYGALGPEGDVEVRTRIATRRGSSARSGT